MEKTKEREKGDFFNFSTPEGCIEALESCLNRKEELLKEKTAQMEYFVTNWVTIVSLCAQSIRGEMGDILGDDEREKINSFVEEAREEPMNLKKSEDFINETIEVLERMADLDGVAS